MLVAGTSAAAFRDAPEVWAVMNYYASSDYANNRQAAQLERKGQTAGQDISGFLSAAKGADAANYSPLEQGFLEVLATGDPAGFDASDQMPGDVGSGTFWQRGHRPGERRGGRRKRRPTPSRRRGRRPDRSLTQRRPTARCRRPSGGRHLAVRERRSNQR